MAVLSASGVAALKRLQKMPEAWATGAKVGLVAATEVLKLAAAAEVDRKAPGGRMRGVGRGGGRVGVRAQILGRVARVYMSGAGAHLIERDTAAHPIRAHGPALRTPYGPRISVQHPGTHGSHPFEKGILAGLPAARVALMAGVRGALAKNLLGGRA